MRSLQLILSKARYFAPALVFASLNIIIGTWAIYIPSITKKIGMDEGDLGLGIFFMALGTLVMILMAPKIIARLGVGKATAYGLFIFLFTFIIPFGVTDYWLFCTGMFIVGAFSGFTDVSMNTLVTEIEKEDGVHIMSANHGFFSLGGFLGAGIGGLFLGKEFLPLHHLLVVIGILLLVNLIVVKHYFKIRAGDGLEGSFQLKNFRPLLVLGSIGFFVMASEGAIVDWSALYLEKVSLARLSWVGLGFTAFSATMAFGRFLGDEISARYGSKFLISGGSLLGILGFVCILLVHPILAIIGFGLVGFGLSVIIPELFRLGGKTPGIPSSQSISFVSGVGFFGFLVGPVLLGFLAERSSLKLSFLALLMFIVLSLLLSLKLKK